MESVFLFCFALGAIFTLLTTLIGAIGSGLHGLGGHLSAPTGGAGHGVGHAVGHAVGHQLSHGTGHELSHLGVHRGGALLGAGHRGSFVGSALALLLNPSGVLLGLTVFGGLGYIAMHFWMWSVLFALALAVPPGLAGTLLFGAFMGMLRRDSGTMANADYQLEGTVADVTISIGANAVGEIVFVLGGVRRSKGARSLSGHPIPKGTQVVIMAFDHAFALVEPAAEVAGSLDAHVTDPQRAIENQADQSG